MILDCLAEIGNLSDLEPQYNPLFQKLLEGFLQRLSEIFDHNANLTPAFEKGTEEDCIFIQRLTLFLNGFFKAHLKVMENHESQQHLLKGLFYLVRVSEVPDTEIFRICLETWHMLAQDLYQASHNFHPTAADSVLNIGTNGNSSTEANRNISTFKRSQSRRKLEVGKTHNVFGRDLPIY